MGASVPAKVLSFSADYPTKDHLDIRLSATDRGAATAANTPPKRNPDAVLEEKTSPTQAALYRYVALICRAELCRADCEDSLSGDPNPLHVRICRCSSASNSIDLVGLSVDPARVCSHWRLRQADSSWCVLRCIPWCLAQLTHCAAGLCSFGISGKHVLKSFGPYKDIKARYASTLPRVYPH